MTRDLFGLCVVCGRRDICCEHCHRAHDYQWANHRAGGGLVAIWGTNPTTMTVVDRGDRVTV